MFTGHVGEYNGIKIRLSLYNRLAGWLSHQVWKRRNRKVFLEYAEYVKKHPDSVVRTKEKYMFLMR